MYAWIVHGKMGIRCYYIECASLLYFWNLFSAFLTVAINRQEIERIVENLEARIVFGVIKNITTEDIQ